MADREGFIRYDRFDERRLDAKKWYGEQLATGGSGGLEIVRRVNRHGRLVMRHRVSGGDHSHDGRHISRNRMRMLDTDAIYGMRFDVKVKRVWMHGCAAEGASKSSVRARGVMFLFNDGSSTGSTDARGDVGTVVEVYRSTASDGAYDNNNKEMNVRGFLFRCKTTGCGTSEILDQVDLGTVSRWQWSTLGMTWDPERDEVSFRMNDGEDQVIAYDHSDADAPVRSNKRLEVRVEGANCTDGGSFAEMKAVFDNVAVQR
ncbi:MAG: hypothetical protein OEU26_09825 [Candidatus Tectomicrobia bacterium]|nr:hypothetical protein [Candidatus Tectomicrobia bacterium]